ncbi:MAG: hypothetical protein IT363_00240 [Methanoregulaceae archaeon]|nr:hypothetical protein [Methanoregulaceae archaeon]
MKRVLIVLGLLASFAASAFAQDVIAGKVVRIRVNHADPWFIVAMLENWGVTSPELSTLFNALGAPQAGNALNRLFKGKFVVNPTDNSILFFPDPN